MASTRWEDTSFAVAAIGNRTDSSGSSVEDFSAEEARLVNSMLVEGYFDDNDFEVNHVSGNMRVRVGSGTSKNDRYVVPGTAGGQGNYLVRLEQSLKNIDIDAAPSSGTRIDEIWLVVEDQSYETNNRALVRLAYRKGDTDQGNPGPDASWLARSLLARVTVEANVTSISAGDISDQRPKSTIHDHLIGGVVGRMDDVESTYGGVLIDSFTWSGGNNPTFSNLPQEFQTFEFMGQFRFDQTGQYEGTFRLNGVNDNQYVSMAETRTASGSSIIDSSDLGINMRAGRYGSTFSTVWARFTQTGTHNRIAVVGNGFGRHGQASSSRYITQFGGYLIGENTLDTIRFNVGGALASGLCTFSLYGYR